MVSGVQMRRHAERVLTHTPVTDVFLVLPIAMGMANNFPAKVLSRTTPPSRLMSRRVVLSLLSQMVLLLLA